MKLSEAEEQIKRLETTLGIAGKYYYDGSVRRYVVTYENDGRRVEFQKVKEVDTFLSPPKPKRTRRVKSGN